ncbi:MAG: NAD(P)/FAD-dependent oxidoreductase [Alphaproteobacteria bacterium]|nr:NAD(P)/FAD-dependent oxidoreductase [Alphaproteobacteria bacterium]
MPTLYDVIIIGGGAAGLMAAIQAGKLGKKTLLIEHTDKIGEKIRISGGGRCNFTNQHAAPHNYICSNPHFVKSALASYTQHDFIKMVEAHKIAYHEKILGQLFCDGSSMQIISMLLDQCKQHSVLIKTKCTVTDVSKADHFTLKTSEGELISRALIIASGGLSIPKIGASDFGYRIAKWFGLKIIPTRPALVPLIVAECDRAFFTDLSGVSNYSAASYGETAFAENILFTHRGLSGPAILQISSYLKGFNNETIILNLLPALDLKQQFMMDKKTKQTPANYLKNHLTSRLIDHLAQRFEGGDFHKPITDLRKDNLFTIADQIHRFQVLINGSEGYAKAEVTVGGVDTNELSSKTMMCKNVPGLFFIGEVVDVTGWLGGYNFQWAWSSGFAAGNYC